MGGARSEASREEHRVREQVVEGITRVSRKTAHGLNNLLMVLQGGLEMYEDRKESDLPGAERALDMVRSATEGVRSLAVTLQRIRGPRKEATEQHEIAELVAAWAGNRRDALPSDVAFELEQTEAPTGACIERAALDASLDALLANAVEAQPEGGRVVVRTSTQEDEDGGRTVIEVVDEGEGMDAATRARLFEPFFTTKKRADPTGEGEAHKGLGLPLVWGFVRHAKGTIWINSAEGEGTTVRIELPRVASEKTVAEPEVVVEDAMTDPVNPDGRVVLIVDDDPSVREVMVMALQKAGYHVLQAGGGHEALAMVRDYQRHIHLLLTDIVMPGMNGKDLAEQFLGLRPTTQILYTSGFTTDVLGIFGGMAPSPFLQKPFTTEALKKTVNDLL